MSTLALLAVILPASLAAQTLAVAFPEEHRVLLFDGRTYDSVASVSVGLGPHEIAEPKQYTITRIDVAEPARTSAIDAGDCAGLHDLHVSRSGTLLWVACARARAVAEIELATGRMRRRWPITLDGGWMLTGSRTSNGCSSRTWRVRR